MGDMVILKMLNGLDMTYNLISSMLFSKSVLIVHQTDF